MTTLSDTFLDHLKELYTHKSFIKPYQKKAWEAFCELKLPHPKHEAFKYYKLNGLYQSKPTITTNSIDSNWIESEKALYPNQNILVTYNGQFLKDYSTYPDLEDELEILPLEEAELTYGAFIKSFLENLEGKEKDPFALLALSFYQKGLFIYVPKKTRLEKELVLLEFTDQKDSAFIPSLNLLSLGEEAQMSLSRKIIAKESTQAFTTTYWGFFLDHKAHLKQQEYHDLSDEHHFHSYRILQQKESTYQWVGGCLKPKKWRASFHAQLKGVKAHCDLKGLLTLKNKEQGHVHILIEHEKEETTSSQLFKHLVNQEALCSFEGKIFIEKEAQKSNAYQLNQNCLLSDQASAYSKPGLEIFADDVKASHGSTTGQMDLEELFYLRSRGFDLAQAQKMLLKGFCEEVFESVVNKPLMASFNQKLNQYFE